MTAKSSNRLVDHSALRVNQSFIIGLLILAFVLSSPLIVAFVAGVMLVGTAWPKLALFQAIYRNVLKPANLVKPHVITDNPEPHRFAQGFGGTVLVVGVLALFLGQTIVGWALVWMVDHAGGPQLVCRLLRGMLRLLPAQSAGRAGLPLQPDPAGITHVRTSLARHGLDVAWRWQHRLFRYDHLRHASKAAVAIGKPAILYFRSDTCTPCP